MSLYKSVVKALQQLKTLPCELFFPENVLYITGDLHLNQERFDFSNHNLGDDLNLPLVVALSGKQVLPIRYSLLGKHRRHFLVIGSILEAWCSCNSIVWGTGLIKPLSAPLPKPEAIYAVRGPMTRKELLRYGIDCPDVYGDPAILLPQIYNPMVVDCHGVGLIPHLADREHPFVVKWRERGGKVLDLGKYGDWRTFIRELKSCRGILSSSLHGLILADTYGVPSRRIILGNLLVGGDFKFFDYYLSFLEQIPPALRTEDVNYLCEEDILRLIHKEWHPLPAELPQNLLASCPFYCQNRF